MNVKMESSLASYIGEAIGLQKRGASWSLTLEKQLVYVVYIYIGVVMCDKVVNNCGKSLVGMCNFRTISPH